MGNPKSVAALGRQVDPNMRKIPQIILSTGAAVALMTMLGAAPSAASETAPVAVATPSAAMAWVPPGKSKTRHVRQVRGHPARVASLARPTCGWPVSSCDQQFVLILGIGF
jgi:hypothetical protein